MVVATPHQGSAGWAGVALQSAEYVVLDIETGYAAEDVVSAAVARARADYRPPSNYSKPETIAKHRSEFEQHVEEDTREASALLDASPIICLSARTALEAVLFNGLDAGEAHMVPGFRVLSSGGEIPMLEAFRQWIDRATGPETLLVGFNLIGFDLPRLRAAYVRHRLKLPQILVPGPLDELQPAVDVMRLFLRFFTAERHMEKFISLGEVTKRLGLPAYKGAVDGSEIPRLARDGRVKEVLTYCALDCLATWSAFRLLTNQADSQNGVGVAVEGTV